jgi:hypothetical protein
MKNIKMPAMTEADRDTLVKWLQGLPVVDVNILDTEASISEIEKKLEDITTEEGQK